LEWRELASPPAFFFFVFSIGALFQKLRKIGQIGGSGSAHSSLLSPPATVLLSELYGTPAGIYHQRPLMERGLRGQFAPLRPRARKASIQVLCPSPRIFLAYTASSFFRPAALTVTPLGSLAYLTFTSHSRRGEELSDFFSPSKLKKSNVCSAQPPKQAPTRVGVPTPISFHVFCAAAKLPPS